MTYYTMTKAEHECWYSDDQRTHDRVHDYLRVRLEPGTEVYDTDGIIVDVIPGD